jgi:hypothetical protein
MASPAQIEANRRNAQRSTGPTSETGKAISSQNALKHGLSGSTTAALMASESDRSLLEERKALWRPEFRPQGAEEEAFFETLVAEQIRVERCRDAFFSLCRDYGRRAQLRWDVDRRREADDLALKLGRSPQAVARQLEDTKQGAEVKLEFWRALSSSLEKHGTWTDAQRSLALDLLGVHPDLRDGETPVDPALGDVLTVRRALVAEEIARLEELRDGILSDLDASERAVAETTLGAEFTKPVQLMYRYERDATRRMQWAWKRLDAAREDRPLETRKAPAPAPSHATRPVPPPTRPAVPRLPVSAARPTATPIPVETAAKPRDPEPAVRHLNRRERRAQAAMARRAG